MKTQGTHRTLSAILFADIQGYTAIMHSDEAKALSLLNHYQHCLQTQVEKYDGQIIKNYGDGSLCLFSSVLNAVLCAKYLQFSLKSQIEVPLRIGIHLGDVTHMDNDVYGNAINVTSRIESMGIAGNVLLSNSIYEKIKNQPQLETVSLGKFSFKNIEKPIEVFALSNEGLTIPKREQITGKTKLVSDKPAYLKPVSISSILLLLILIIGWAWKNGNAKNLANEALGDKSIAVLAFADMSPKQDQQYFSEGISEEILNLLTKNSELRVISRTSSFSFKEKNLTTEEIAAALGVNHLLDGSIRKSNNNFRITTQLINARSGKQIWSETYDRSMTDIFKIQDEIAAKICQRLEVSILGNAMATRTVNVDAYNLYLEAKLLKDQRNFETDSIAEMLIRESIAIDSTYAPAWATLSELIFNGTYSYSRYSIAEGTPLSQKAGEKAIALDPYNSNGYIALTTLNRANNDFASANENLKKALEIDPLNVDVIYEASSYALDLGNMDEAIVKLRKAITLDPVNYILHYTLGLHLMWVEQYEEAEKAMEKYLRVNPNSGLANNFMSQILIELGKTDAALEAVEKDKDPYWSLYRKSIIYHVIGDKGKADTYLKEFIENFGHEGWPNIAHVYACRGEKDLSFKWLDLSLENEDGSLFEVLNYPEFKILHNDPRWNQFIDKLKLPANEGFSTN